MDKNRYKVEPKRIKEDVILNDVFISGDLQDIIAELNSYLKEYSHYRKLSLRLSTDEEGYTDFVLIGFREENDDEYKDRIAQTLEQAEKIKLRELQEFKRLQKIYGKTQKDD